MVKFNLDPGGLRRAFTPSKEPIWTQIAEEIGGSYNKGGFLGQGRPPFPARGLGDS